MSVVLLGLLVLVPIWIVLCVLVAKWAERKGQSFWAYLLIGLLLSPAIALIVLLGVVAVREDRRDRRDIPPANSGRLEQLKTLSELRASGTLSSDEFEAEKARILGGRA